MICVLFCSVGSINPILDSIGVNYHMFAYRWVNCFLTREIPLTKVLRFWDTYLAEDDKFGGGFSSFHVYVCAVLLTKLSPLITGKEIEDVILVLQDFKRFLPLSDDDIEEIIAQAFVYQSSYSLG